MNEIQKVEYKGALVLTTQQIAEAYETETKKITDNFNNNKDRYIKGKHYVCLEGEDLRKFKNKTENLGFAKNINKLYLWTKKGAFLHAKSLNTDVAWEVYDRLVDDYFEFQERVNETERPRLETVNDTVKILTNLLEKAGCSPKVQLLTAKTLIEQNTGIVLPITIQSDKQYYDTEYIARKVGIYVKSSGKPAEKAVNEIIRRLDISDDMYTETWESVGKWQGTVRKYSQEVIDMIKEWCSENDYPADIEYMQTDGKKKKYHVKWKEIA